MGVAVLTKVPAAGRVKTRLVPALGADAATQLHVAMVADLAEVLAPHRSQLCWHVAGPLDHPWVDGLPGRVVPQAGGDLGARVQAALGTGRCLALGTDAPTLPLALIDQALDSPADVVLGQATDGGCWGIGQARFHAGWLEEIAWSRHTVCADLVVRARTLGLRVAVLPFWSDVDEVHDLRLLVQQLRILPLTVAPHSRAWLAEHPESTWHP